jgi:hypothetical protein
MSARPESAASVREKVWLALRFLLFGFVGFWVMLYSAMAFMLRVFEHNQQFITPFLSLPLIIIGALLILYGVGAWKRWAYLCVFLSVPASLGLVFLILPGTSSKILPVIVIAATAFAVHARVRAYYAGRIQERSQEDEHAG